MKFLKITIPVLAGMCMFGLPSCKKENVKMGTHQLHSTFTSYGVFNLVELSTLPAFAQPLNQSAPEGREFSIKLKDGTILAFKLTSSINGGIFGKERMMGGSVTSDGKTGMATMMIGEDGFDLMYKIGDDHMLRISPKYIIDIGYVEPLLNASDEEVSKLIALAKEKCSGDPNLPDKILVASGRKKSENKGIEYKSVLEAGPVYELIDVNETANNRVRAEGNTACKGFVNKSSSGPSTLGWSENNGSNTSSNTVNDRNTFHLMILYKDGGNYDLSGGLMATSLAHSYLGNNQYRGYVQRNPHVIQFTFTSNDNISANDYVMDIMAHYGQYSGGASGMGGVDLQVDHLVAFVYKYHLNDAGLYATANLHTVNWVKYYGCAIGLAPYAKFDKTGGNCQSVFVACDDYTNTLAHEAGHTFGCEHEPQISYDIMYPYAAGGGWAHIKYAYTSMPYNFYQKFHWFAVQ